MNSINWIDGLSLGVLIWFGGMGLWLGLAQSLFNLIALATAIGTSWALGEFCTKFVLEYLGPQSSPALWKIAVTVLLFLMSYLIVRKAGTLLHKFLHKNALGTLNRLGGFLFGILKAGALLGGVYVLIAWVPKEFIEPHRTQSKAYRLFMSSPLQKWVQNQSFLPNSVPKALETPIMQPPKPFADTIKTIIDENKN